MYISCIFQNHFFNEFYFWTYVKLNLTWCIGTFTIDDEMLEDIDYDKYGEKLPIHVAWYRATKNYDYILKDCIIAGQGQILRCLLVSKKLEGATSLLGIHKVTKESKLKHNVIENIGDAIIFFLNPGKKISVLHIEKFRQQLFQLVLDKNVWQHN